LQQISVDKMFVKEAVNIWRFICFVGFIMHSICSIYLQFDSRLL